MIPQKITLQNFLSYSGQLQTISFASYPLICLSGKNGHGKSALLDAITWALWGQARKISGVGKADEGLVRLGQTHMLVVLEFEQSDMLYRVKREFIKTMNKAQTVLDFEVLHEKRDEFVPLTDKTIRATQEKINQTLGLDFQTFVNTAYLRQGQSNEFSTRTPKERKEIIANILGLGLYDNLRSLATDEAKGFATEQEVLTKLAGDQEQELERADDVKESLEKGQAALKQVAQAHAKAQQALTTAQATKQALDQKKEQHDFLQKQHQQLAASITAKQEAFLALATQFREVHAKSLKLRDAKALEAKIAQAKKQEEAYRTAHQKYLVLQERLLKAKESYAKLFEEHKKRAHDALQKERAQLELSRLALTKEETQSAELEKRIFEGKQKEASLQAQLDKLGTEITAGAKQLAGAKEVRAQFDKRRAAYHAYVQQGNWYGSQRDELSQKRGIVGDEHSPSCPLCEQELTVQRKQFLHDKFVRESGFLQHRYSRLERIIAALKEMLLRGHKEIEQLGEVEKGHAAREQQSELAGKEQVALIAQLKLMAGELGIAKESIAKRKAELEAKDAQVTRKEQTMLATLEIEPTLRDLRRECERLEKERSAITYDAGAHKVIQDELAGLLGDEAARGKLREDQAKQGARRTQLVEVKQDVRALQQQGAKLAKDIAALVALLSGAKELDAKVTQAQVVLAQELKQKEEMQAQCVRLEQEIKRLGELRTKLEASSKRRELLAKEISQYQLLSQIFGKDGVQALLIEEAIPEIEEEANSILSKLTDNRAQIIIESLRDLKKGGVRETLDIRISDAAGIRPYEMFSGGEAFRIDFSLRIAISKLLSRRAGRPLQTLIIDEGFGSQDEEGLQLLMAASHAISGDFARIIVVSHLPVFKDNFPVHLLVEKTPAGSVVRVSERG